MALLPLSITIGILAGAWFYGATTFDIITWPTFISWPIYFLVGANKEAVGKLFPPMIVGILLGYLTVVVNGIVNPSGGLLILSVLIVVLAFILTFMMNVKLLASAPISFAAAASYFAIGDPIKTAIPLIAGLVLAVISTTIPELLIKPSEKQSI